MVPLENSEGDHSEGQAILMQCPLGISLQPLLLVPAVGPLLSVFDGERSVDEIFAHFAPQGLQRSTLDELISLLDAHLFLAGPRFFAAEREHVEQFRALSIRPAALAGAAYPSAETDLRELVDGLLVSPSSRLTNGELTCLVAPHIDYRRGGECYGQIYPYLAGSNADTFILIGTSHQYSRQMFHLSAKDFESPLGRLPCDTEFVSRLAARFGTERAFRDEYLHRREHSLELQLPFISRVRPGARIVPILVGSFYEAIESGRELDRFDEYTSFVGACAEAIQQERQGGRRVCFIAGVDMAHMGRHFGDEGALTPEFMDLVAERDSRYLQAIQEHDLTALFSHVAEDQDARRICGFPTMYTVLDILKKLGDRVTCEVTRYDQAVDYQSDCAVTFAGLALV
jgi:AmmeMemoRadiSam system protein B